MTYCTKPTTVDGTSSSITDLCHSLFTFYSHLPIISTLLNIACFFFSFILFQASKLKAVTYPLIGAAVGGVCGGPLGLAIGLKAGAAIALGGGVLGYFGGRYFKKKQEEATDIQLDNLSSSREVKKYR